MRPRLASLALLLLALCRTSEAATYTWTEETASSASIMFAEQKKPDASPAKMEEATLKKIMNVAGNSVLFAGLAATFAANNGKLPKFFSEALANGVQCEFKNEATLEAAVNSAAYGTTVTPNADEKRELAYDCTPDDDFKKCFCDAGKSRVFCFLKGLYGVATKVVANRKPCHDDVINELKEVGRKVLGPLYAGSGFDKADHAFNDKLDEFIENEDQKAADLLCDAIDPKVEEKVKALYASDAVYWLAEGAVFKKLFNEPVLNLDDKCKSEDFDYPYAKCVCKQDTGFVFCLYKTIAQVFVDEKYLDCGTLEAGKKPFDNAKKPKSLPQIKPGKKNNGGGSGGSPTPAPAPAPANGAADLSLLATAAAMLLGL